MCVCAFVCVYVCMHVYLRIYMCIYMHVCACVCWAYLTERKKGMSIEIMKRITKSTVECGERRWLSPVSYQMFSYEKML